MDKRQHPKCPECSGSGCKTSEIGLCPYCDGTGELRKHQGCLHAPAVEDYAPLDMVIAVGFGFAGITKDGKQIYSEPPNAEWKSLPTLQAFEDRAKNEGGEWWCIIEGPLRGEKYKRVGDGKWQSRRVTWTSWHVWKRLRPFADRTLCSAGVFPYRPPKPQVKRTLRLRKGDVFCGRCKALLKQRLGEPTGGSREDAG